MEFNLILNFIDTVFLQMDFFGMREGPLGSDDPMIKGLILSMFVVAGFGIALNLTNIGGGYILTNEILRWLEKNTQAKQGAIIRRPKKIISPSVASETFINLLDETLALSPGSANYAILVQDISEEDTDNLLLIFVEAGDVFQDVLTQQISEAFKLSNLQGVTLDIIFAKLDDELIKKALKIGLRFDLPSIQEASKPEAPGMDPKKPPILR